MRELECFLFKYFRKRREEKSELSKTRSEPNVVSGKKYRDYWRCKGRQSFTDG